MTAMAALNKGSSRSREIMPIVSEIFWLSVKNDFSLRAVFLPGKENILADRISRMDDVNSAYEVSYLLSGASGSRVSCESHMSNDAFLYLQNRWIEGSSSCS